MIVKETTYIASTLLNIQLEKLRTYSVIKLRYNVLQITVYLRNVYLIKQKYGCDIK